MLKLIYLAKRKPGFDFDGFVRRWRMHGAKGMSGAFWRHVLGYVQAEPIRPAPVAEASEEYDAVACLLLRDEAFAAPPDPAEARAMAEDELETFSAPIPTTSLWVEEERLQDGALGGTTAFLFFAAEAGAREAAERARRAGGLSRIALNRRSDDGPLGPGANTLPYQAVVELAAHDLPGLLAVVGPDGEGLLAKADLAVLTREAVLWDRLSRQEVKMTHEEKIADAVNTYIASFEKKDLDAIMDLYADECWIEDPVGSERKVGREAIRAFYAQAIELDVRMTLESEIRIAGHEAAFAFRLEAKLPNGTLSVRPIDVMTFDDEGKVTSMRAYFGPTNQSLEP